MQTSIWNSRQFITKWTDLFYLPFFFPLEKTLGKRNDQIIQVPGKCHEGITTLEKVSIYFRKKLILLSQGPLLVPSTSWLMTYPQKMLVTILEPLNYRLITLAFLLERAVAEAYSKSAWLVKIWKNCWSNVTTWKIKSGRTVLPSPWHLA